MGVGSKTPEPGEDVELDQCIIGKVSPAFAQLQNLETRAPQQVLWERLLRPNFDEFLLSFEEPLEDTS